MTSQYQASTTAFRLWLVKRTEQMAVVVRYAFFAVGATLTATGLALDWSVFGILVIVPMLLIHNAFVHLLFAFKRYSFFSTPWNFAINFGEMCVIVLFSIGQDNPAFVVFILFLIGLSPYMRSPFRFMQSTALCVSAHVLIHAYEYSFARFIQQLDVIILQVLAISVAGYMIVQVTRLLERAEIEARRQALALATSESTLRMILDAAADPIVVFNTEDVIIEANDKACAFLKVRRPDLLNRRIRAYMFDDGTLAERRESMRERGRFKGEQVFIDAEGEEHTADLFVRSFIRDGERLFVGLVHDRTGSKELEEADRRAQERMKQLERELREIAMFKADYVESVSQRLRSPLTTILGFTGMLAEGELGELSLEQRDAVSACRRSAQRMLREINAEEDAQLQQVEAGAGVPRET